MPADTAGSRKWCPVVLFIGTSAREVLPALRYDVAEYAGVRSRSLRNEAGARRLILMS